MLNQEFLLDAAEDTRKELSELLRVRQRRAVRDEGPLDEIGSEEIREVTEQLALAIDAQPAGEVAKDASVYMPRDPLLAILQSELDACSRQQNPTAVEDDPDGPTERRIADVDVRRLGDGRRAFGKFEVTRPKFLSDPRWVWSGVVIAWHKFKAKAPFGGLPDAALPINDSAKVLLVGDWGSGIERAKAVAAQMRAELDRGVRNGVEQHVVHLGDVYYTGSEDEYRDRFLAHWPVRVGEDIASYALVGNHDMYRGGHAFYDLCLKDPRFARQDGRSVFGLRSGGWQLLGLDTSYDDAGLYGDQAEWVRSRRREAPAHRTTLLSHHQLFSAYERAGERLRPRIQSVLADGLDAWFWAHEHRCLAYDPQDAIGFSSCIGHGGIPEYLVAAEGDPLPDGLRYDYRKRHGHGVEPWNTFGFAVLDLAGRGMTIRYLDEHGSTHHTEELPA